MKILILSPFVFLNRVLFSFSPRRSNNNVTFVFSVTGLIRKCTRAILVTLSLGIYGVQSGVLLIMH